jgi:hypothetical protein
MLQSDLASSATLAVPRNSGREGLEHFGGKSAIPLRLPRRRRKQTLFQLPKLGSQRRHRLLSASHRLLGCSLKFEFSFLNGNLMAPAGHQIIFDNSDAAETGFHECGGRQVGDR